MLRSMMIILLSLMVLTACGKKQTGPDDGTQQPTGDGAVTTPSDGRGAQPVSMDPFNDPDNPLSTKIIYFDYDSSQVRPEFIAAVNAHAAYLAGNASADIRLEGHADERGSREYNIALSERRALSVKRLMSFEGARGDQIKTLAYGEERPVEFGHNESAWSKNRRVEIIYVSQ